MKASAFWKTVVSDKSDFLERILALLEDNSNGYCSIGGQAVNAYADPVVSLDLDIVIDFAEIERVESLLRRQFRVEAFQHSLNVAAPGSDLRVQIQMDPRYADSLEKSGPHDVLGMTLPVADVADVLRGKVWAAGDPTGLPSKRLKDLADIARILEGRPDLVDHVPPEIRAKLV